MCGMSLHLPPAEEGPLTTLNNYLCSPSVTPLVLLTDPAFAPSTTASVTTGRAEGLLSASEVERLAYFRLHVSFRGVTGGGNRHGDRG